MFLLNYSKHLTKMTMAKSKSKKLFLNVFFYIAVFLLIVLMVSLGLFWWRFGNSLYQGEPFRCRGKSWVGLDMPIFQVSLLNDKDCGITCGVADIEKQLQGIFGPALKFSEVDLKSKEGQQWQKDFTLPGVPAVIFDQSIKSFQYFADVQRIASEKNGYYYLPSKELRLPLGKVSQAPTAGDDPAFGPENAKVKVIEFTDYECPYCGKYSRETFDKIKENYGDKIRYVLKDFPLDFHANARLAATSANCAEKQGKYWEMHHELFADQDAWAQAEKPDEKIKEIAGKVGLDAKQFDACLQDDAIAQEINEDVEYGGQLGVSGTPAFFVNDKTFSGFKSYEDFKAIIDQELNR